VWTDGQTDILTHTDHKVDPPYFRRVSHKLLRGMSNLHIILSNRADQHLHTCIYLSTTKTTTTCMFHKKDSMVCIIAIYNYTYRKVL